MICKWMPLPLLLLAAGTVFAETDKSLVLHYDFAENTGNAVIDKSSYAMPGKVINGAYLAELDGERGVMRLNGENAYIDCGNAPQLAFNYDLSFEITVRQNGPIPSKGAVIFSDLDKRECMFFITNWHTLQLYMGNRAEQSSSGLPVDRGLVGPEWSHITVVMEFPRCRFYRNGVLIADQLMIVPPEKTVKSSRKFIGGFPQGSSAPIDVADFKLYNRALSRYEVARHYAGKEVTDKIDYELFCEPDFYRNTINLRAASKGVDSRGNTAAFRVRELTGRGDFTEASPGTGRFNAGAEIAGLDKLAGNSCEVEAEIRTADGKVLKTLHKQLSLEKPYFVHSPEGKLQGKAPAPWTPLETVSTDGKLALKVWNRTYEFPATGPMIGAIDTAGTEILAAPATLNLNGKALARTALKVEQADALAATFTDRFEQGGLTVTGKSVAEYDGYIIFDYTLTADRPTEIGSFNLTVPFKQEYANLACADRVFDPPSRDLLGDAWFSGEIGEGQNFQFTPNLFIGNADLGLTFQAESDEFYRNGDRQKAIQILRDGKTTTLKINFIDTPTKLKPGECFHYRFALMAFPAKPQAHDIWDLRLARAEPYGGDLDTPDAEIDGKPAFQDDQDRGFKRLFFNVNESFSWPLSRPGSAAYDMALHRYIDTAHSYGLKVHPYLIHQRIPVNIPEFEVYGPYMVKYPWAQYSQGFNGPDPDVARPGPISVKYGANSQQTLFMCFNSEALRDAVAASLAKRLDIFGDDGVYLDGTCHLVPCSNPLHGCGYVGTDGKRRPTYPTFAVREMLRRIYLLTRARNPENIVDVHCSWGYNMPALAYADVMWNGERWFQFRARKPESAAAELPVGRFLAEHTGRQIGIAADILTYRLGGDMPVAGVSLLYDVPPRFNSTETFFTRLYKMREEFGIKEAEKFFFYDNHGAAAVTPEAVKATLFNHPHNGMLLFVSNWSTQAQNATVKLNLPLLKQSGTAWQGIDYLAGTPVAVSPEGEFKITLSPQQWTYIWIKRK